MFVSIGTLFTVAAMGLLVYVILRLGKVRTKRLDDTDHFFVFLILFLLLGLVSILFVC